MKGPNCGVKGTTKENKKSYKSNFPSYQLHTHETHTITAELHIYF